MPLYMDYHNKIDGLTANVVAAAHEKDLGIQDHHAVKYLKHWFDEGESKVICDVEVPTREATVAVHGEGHGLVAHGIIEATQGD